MANPQIPGAAVMTDTLDFVKNLWGSMSVPGLTAPTLSVEELDKKINDLKAVEAWLNLNMSMLRGSIQALEVQRGTIATLKSVGASLAAAVNQGGAQAGDKSIFDANPYASAFFHHAREAEKAPAPPPPPAAEAPKPEAASGADAGAQMANPAVWWNMLQDQFKQAVASTVPATPFGAPASADGAVSKPAATNGNGAGEAAPRSPKKPAKS